MPRYRVIEFHGYTLTFDVEAPTALAAREMAAEMAADEADEDELGTQHTTVQMLLDGPVQDMDDDYCVDQDGVEVDIRQWVDEACNPFDHVAGPHGCLDTCAACGWDAMQEEREEAQG